MTLAKSITRSCPYNCGESVEIRHPLEGFQLMTCPRCQKPWVIETSLVPFVQARMVEGFGIAPTLPTPEEIEQDIKEDPEEILGVDCGKPADTGSPFQILPAQQRRRLLQVVSLCQQVHRRGGSMTAPLKCTPTEAMRLASRINHRNPGRKTTPLREQAIVDSILRTRCVMATVRELHCGPNTVRQICKRRGVRI
jgi:hypothetical protein